jgi:hypothetical protein
MMEKLLGGAQADSNRIQLVALSRGKGPLLILDFGAQEVAPQASQHSILVYFSEQECPPRGF